MEGKDKVCAVLDEMKLPYSHEDVDEELLHFSIVVDSSEDLTISGLLYNSGEEANFRLLAYLDELSEEDALDQLTGLMALNGELPTGAFCMDPEEEVIYITVNIPVRDLTADMLGWVIELVYAAQDMYFQEFVTEVPEGEA